MVPEVAERGDMILLSIRKPEILSLILRPPIAHHTAMNLSFEIFPLLLVHSSFTQNFLWRGDIFTQKF